MSFVRSGWTLSQDATDQLLHAFGPTPRRGAAEISRAIADVFIGYVWTRMADDLPIQSSRMKHYRLIRHTARTLLHLIQAGPDGRKEKAGIEFQLPTDSRIGKSATADGAFHATVNVAPEPDVEPCATGLPGRAV
jgi:hypothetical protein